MKSIIAALMIFSMLVYPSINSEDKIANIENEYNLMEEELEIYEATNEIRNENNLENLKIDYEIENIARLKALDMVKNGYFEHKSPTYGNIENMLDESRYRIYKCCRKYCRKYKCQKCDK